LCKAPLVLLPEKIWRTFKENKAPLVQAKKGGLKPTLPDNLIFYFGGNPIAPPWVV
jgi:hypothetical protein